MNRRMKPTKKVGNRRMNWADREPQDDDSGGGGAILLLPFQRDDPDGGGGGVRLHHMAFSVGQGCLQWWLKLLRLCSVAPLIRTWACGGGGGGHESDAGGDPDDVGGAGDGEEKVNYWAW